MKIKKSFCAIMIVAILISQMMLSALAIQPEHKYYSDVNSSDYYYDATNYLYDHNVLLGYSLPNGTNLGIFQPNTSISRGQLAVVLWRMLNKPQPSGNLTSFQDVNQGVYYYDAVTWASSSNVGIINGYGDGTFRPDNSVTQQTACIFLYKFACHCEYSNDSDYAQQQYISVLNSSTLVNKYDFSSQSKSAAGWAYSHGLLDDNVVPTAAVSRGNIAEYIYEFYIEFQNKYGLSVVNTTNMSYVLPCGIGMKNLFSHYGANDAISCNNITSAQFHNEMANAFGGAKGLDICYLYIASHGSTSGLTLFTNGTLYPATLRSEIDRFNGTFVVFVSGCHSGTYISEDEEQLEIDTTFDADAFVNGIYNETLENDYYSEDLRDSNRIKVLCSSKQEEQSYSTDRLATNYWCMGSGYDFRNNQFVSLYADSNSDGRISLEELYVYSQYQIQVNLTQNIQTVVRSPHEDGFIIFEIGY